MCRAPLLPAASFVPYVARLFSAQLLCTVVLLWLSSIAYAAVTACTVQALVACSVFVAGAPEWPMQPASVGQELLCCAALAASAGDVL